MDEERRISRYETCLPDESQSGSNGTVFSNKLGIIDPIEIQVYEQAFIRASLDRLFVSQKYPLPITLEMIRGWHSEFFGELYYFAGEWRTVEIYLPDDEGLQFCRSKHIDVVMNEYGKVLAAYKPPATQDALAYELARLHAEFIIIHPFRDGNGRTGRMITQYLLCNAGLYRYIWELVLQDRQSYYRGIRNAVIGDYLLLADLFRRAMA